MLLGNGEWPRQDKSSPTRNNGIASKEWHLSSFCCEFQLWNNDSMMIQVLFRDCLICSNVSASHSCIQEGGYCLIDNWRSHSLFILPLFADFHQAQHCLFQPMMVEDCNPNHCSDGFNFIHCHSMGHKKLLVNGVSEQGSSIYYTTKEAKGATRKYRGWYNERLCTYKEIVKKWKSQCRQHISGKRFQDGLLKEMTMTWWRVAYLLEWESASLD